MTRIRFIYLEKNLSENRMSISLCLDPPGHLRASTEQANVSNDRYPKV